MRYEPKPEDIEHLREWLKKVPYLPQDLEDHYLGTFLRGCKGSLERTKQVLDNYYYGRIKYPHFMANLDPLLPSAQTHMNVALKVPLPKKTKDGSVIIVASMIDDDPDKFDPVEAFKRFACIVNTLIHENDMGSNQLIFIIVCGKMKLGHILKYSPSLITSAIDAMTSAVPCRIEAVHGVNVPAAAEWMFSLAKSLVKSKISERIHLHRSAEELLVWYPKEILPSDFGGDEECLKKLHDNYRKKLEKNSRFYQEKEMKLRKLEKLRPKRDDIVTSIGSFRKLEVD